MNKGKHFALLILLPFLGIFTDLPGQPGERSRLLRWVVTKNSSITVKGESNVNKFQCIVIRYLQPDTLQYLHEKKLNKQLFRGTLSVDVVMFDCHNKHMTGDMRKTLKAETYPRLHISFLSLEHPMEHLHTNQSIPGLVEVTLAGVTKQFRLLFQFQLHENGDMVMVGEHGFLFTDFGLVPPHKMAGMIRVKNEFKVQFNLLLKQV